MNLKTPAEVLYEAADLIATRGHHQGSYKAPDSEALCLHGACELAMGGTLHGNPGNWTGWVLEPVDNRQLRYAVANRIRQELKREGLPASECLDSCLPGARWNDRSTTTREDVILLLKRAAAHDEEGTP